MNLRKSQFHLLRTVQSGKADTNSSIASDTIDKVQQSKLVNKWTVSTLKKKPKYAQIIGLNTHQTSNDALKQAQKDINYTKKSKLFGEKGKLQSQMFQQVKQTLQPKILHQSNLINICTSQGQSKQPSNSSSLISDSSVHFQKINYTIPEPSTQDKRRSQSKSKSKNKIQFTVYSNRKQENSRIITYPKQDKVNTCPIQIEEAFTPKKIKFSQLQKPENIQFTHKFSRKHENSACNIKIKHRSGSKQQQEKSLEKNQSSLSKNHSKSLKKVGIKQLPQKMNQKHERTIQKIRRYKFIQNYFSRLQIEGKLNEYELNGQPECKWILLIVDEAFTRMKYMND